MTAPKPVIRADGFTLLEIMVSLAVLSIVMVSLFRLHASTLDLADAARQKKLFPLAAREQLAKILADLDQEGELSGELDLEGQAFTWTCQVSQETFEAPVSISQDQARRFKKLVFTLTETETGQSLSLTTWRYQGDPAKP